MGMSTAVTFRIATVFLLGFGCLVYFGCGGSRPIPQTANEAPNDDDTLSSETVDVSQSSPYESTQPAANDQRVSEMGEMAPPIPETWELNANVCQALKPKYESLTLQDEMHKAEQRNLGPRQRKAAETNAQSVSQQAAQNWFSACQDIVGTIQVRQRWECAEKATTLDRFTGCIDGKFDAELNLDR